MLPHETLLERPLEQQESPTRQRVLIVEDDHAQAEVLAHRFRKQGYLVEIAGNGALALSAVRRHHPALILMDNCLPDVDGLRLSRELSDDESTCSIPIIMLSAMERPDIIRSSRAAGCQYFVRKPYDPNALLLLAEAAMHDGEAW